MNAALIALLLPLLGAQAAPSEAFQARATGHFIPDEPPHVIQQTLEQSIERSVQSMTWAWRPIARPRLKRTVHWCTGWTTVLDGDSFSSKCDGDTEPLDIPFEHEGMTVPDDEGEPMKVSLMVEEPSAELELSYDLATYTRRYDFADDGTVVVTVTIGSPYFGVPIVHPTRYRRVGGTAAKPSSPTPDSAP